LPLLSRESSPEAVDAAFERILRACFWFHAVLAIVLAAFATPVVLLLYGEAYLPAAGAFSLVVLGAPFIALGVVSSGWLVIRRCTGHALRRTLLGMATNVALNVVLIPRMGIAGAALATLLAQLVATYAADAWYPETRVLFKLKSRALLPVWQKAH
jgi:O-antigen/teichoic acid export membrane protein